MISDDLVPSRSVGFAHEKATPCYHLTRKPSNQLRGQSPHYNPQQASQRPTRRRVGFAHQGKFLYFM